MKSRLQKIATKTVIQGFDHKRKITEFYATLNRAARLEFTEDNRPTLEAFLSECFEESLQVLKES
jgi:hypothetical protein